MPGHIGGATSVSFDDTGTRLASVGPYGVARVWMLDPDRLAEIVETKLIRSFTEAECRAVPPPRLRVRSTAEALQPTCNVGNRPTTRSQRPSPKVWVAHQVGGSSEPGECNGLHHPSQPDRQQAGLVPA